MTEFIKIKGSYYQLDHVVAVKRVKLFKDAAGKSIQYVVRLSEEAAGSHESRYRNRWCTRAEVEPFLRRMKEMIEPAEEPVEDERDEKTKEVSSVNPREVK